MKIDSTQSTSSAIAAAIQGMASADFCRAASGFFEILGYPATHQEKYSSQVLNEHFGASHATYLIAQYSSPAELSVLPNSMSASRRTKRESDPTILTAIAIDVRDDRFAGARFQTVSRALQKELGTNLLCLFRQANKCSLYAVLAPRTKAVQARTVSFREIEISRPATFDLESLVLFSWSKIKAKGCVNGFEDFGHAVRHSVNRKDLNGRFYKELANWYFWACQSVAFPDSDKLNESRLVAENLIRLITRIIFCWFIREKGLMPAEVFSADWVNRTLRTDSSGLENSNDSSYYKAILQNLFFSTLNLPLAQRRESKFSLRWKKLFCDERGAYRTFAQIPFLNGGLFDCVHEAGDESTCLDGYCQENESLSVPNFLFFSAGHIVDLSAAYHSKSYRNVKVRGLFRILAAYKFSIYESFGLDEEFALDPELLGLAFENLLAAYNPETRRSARKQSGSFYTPPEIVDSMVEKTLRLYLSEKLLPSKDASTNEEALASLLSFRREVPRISVEFARKILATVDELKVIDPACGSGAFPIGMFRKLLFVKSRLARIINGKVDLEVVDKPLFQEKIQVITNSIYGVDIQPVATQITKLRFFLSLIADQNYDRVRENCGIVPLPNLEARFISADSLISLASLRGLFETNREFQRAESALKVLREQLLKTSDVEEKMSVRRKDQEVRDRIVRMVTKSGFSSMVSAVLSSWNPHELNQSAGFFEIDWMFGLNRGFDICIANPPYGIKYAPEQKKILSLLYKHHYRLESYMLFLERAFDFLSSSGRVCFIIPNPWLSNLRCGGIRQLVLKNHSLEHIAHYQQKVFDATVDTQVVIVKKGACSDNAINIELVKREDRISVRWAKQAIWRESADSPINIFLTSEDESIKAKVLGLGRPLGKICQVRSGIVPYEVGKGVPRQTREMLENRVYDATTKVDSDYRPLLRGSDVSKFGIDWPKNRWIKYGRNLAAPRAQDIFFGGDKIVIRQTGDEIIAAVDTARRVCLKNLHVARLRESGYTLRFIVAVLNSSLMTFYLRCLNPEEGEALAEVKKEHVENLPIFTATPAEQKLIADLVSKIEGCRLQNTRTYSRLCSDLDAIVFRMYRLTKNEIEYVKSRIAQIPTLADAEFQTSEIASIDTVINA